MDLISREDAIEMIEKEKAYMISHAGTFQVKCFDKAISDMDKLQKIEKIVKHNKGCIDVPDDECESDHYKCQIKRIEKIMEG